MRKFRMYVECGTGEYSDMVGLFFEVAGVIVDKIVDDNIDNLLIESSELYKRNCEKFEFDSRFDRMEIAMRYSMGM